MVAPLVVLAVLAIVSGFWNVTGGFNAFMGEGETHGFFAGACSASSPILRCPLIALLVALLGHLPGLRHLRQRNGFRRRAIGRAFRPLYTLFSRKYFLGRAVREHHRQAGPDQRSVRRLPVG